MWNRVEVKAKGKFGFKRNYWPSVIVAIVMTVLTATVSYNVSVRASGNTEPSTGVYVFSGLALIVAILVALFVWNVLEVGCARFFLMNQLQPAEMREMLYGFKNNYQTIVIAQFIRYLFTAIGFVLFIIPGVILFYQYRMVPYILSERSDLKPMDALNASKEMMYGNKWNAFVYDLSFIGWYILGTITCGILNLFYVNPYKYCSDAELYLVLRAGQINANRNYEAAAPVENDPAPSAPAEAAPVEETAPAAEVTEEVEATPAADVSVEPEVTPAEETAPATETTETTDVPSADANNGTDILQL